MLQVNVMPPPALYEELSDSLIGMILAERSDTGESITGCLANEVGGLSVHLLTCVFAAGGWAAFSLSPRCCCC